MPRTTAFLLALAFVVSACDYSVNDGAVGPPGPRGPAGPPGESAEVFVETFELRTFARNFSDSGIEVQYEEPFPELTEDVVDLGLVMVYASDVVDSDGLVRDGWTPLPLAFGVDIATEDEPGDNLVDYTLTTTFTADIGRLFVNVIASDVITIGELQDDGYFDDLERVRFRLVAIPGNQAGRRAGLDWSDYEAVRAAFDLPE